MIFQMSSAPAISVIIPVYNAEQYLSQCLDSLLSQSFPALEIIAVDDGSNDSSFSILERHAEQDPRLKITRQRNQGASVARNLGAADARGEYIWFVDADDYVAPSSLQILYEAAKESRADVLVFNGIEFGADRSSQRLFSCAKPVGVVNGEQWLHALLRQDNLQYLVYLHLYRRRSLLDHKLRFLEGIVHEDNAWVVESYLCAQRVAFVDQVLYFYRRHSNSVMAMSNDKKRLKRIDSYFAVVEQMRELRIRYPMSAETDQMLGAEIARKGIIIDTQARRLVDTQMRDAIFQRCANERFWQRLWRDSRTLRYRRKIVRVIFKEWWARSMRRLLG